jgi:hypothetical protein
MYLLPVLTCCENFIQNSSAGSSQTKTATEVAEDEVAEDNQLIMYFRFCFSAIPFNRSML